METPYSNPRIPNIRNLESDTITVSSDITVGERFKTFQNGYWAKTEIQTSHPSISRWYIEPEGYLSGSYKDLYVYFRADELHVLGSAYSNAGLLTSDDRIKYNETDISNSLEILDKLKPMKYEKIVNIKEGEDWIPSDASWNEIKNETDASGNRLWNYTDEIGLIAQDVQNIPDLSFCVVGEETDEEGNQTPLNLNYNNIFSVMIQAVKDLSAKNKELEARISALETQ
jgi:hypothetical protein|tara:strand:- start:667 stop:1350 length:684 start_codon:yes stop_codon:yes gene_type:complete